MRSSAGHLHLSLNGLQVGEPRDAIVCWTMSSKQLASVLARREPTYLPECERSDAAADLLLKTPHAVVRPSVDSKMLAR